MDRAGKVKKNVKEDSEVSILTTTEGLGRVRLLPFSHKWQIKEVRSWFVQLPLNQEQRLPGRSHLTLPITTPGYALHSLPPHWSCRSPVLLKVLASAYCS